MFSALCLFSCERYSHGNTLVNISITTESLRDTGHVLGNVFVHADSMWLRTSLRAERSRRVRECDSYGCVSRLQQHEYYLSFPQSRRLMNEVCSSCHVRLIAVYVLYVIRPTASNPSYRWRGSALLFLFNPHRDCCFGRSSPAGRIGFPEWSRLLVTPSTSTTTPTTNTSTGGNIMSHVKARWQGGWRQDASTKGDDAHQMMTQH